LLPTYLARSHGDFGGGWVCWVNFKEEETLTLACCGLIAVNLSCLDGWVGWLVLLLIWGIEFIYI
jgi:hypothetical protein